MKIKVPCTEPSMPLNICNYVNEMLDGAADEIGAVETAQKTADNCRAAFGRLIDIMATKGLLTAGEVFTVATSWFDDKGQCSFVVDTDLTKTELFVDHKRQMIVPIDTRKGK